MVECWPGTYKALGSTLLHTQYKPGMMAHRCNPSIQEVKGGGSDGQDHHPSVYTSFEVSLDYKERKGRGKEGGMLRSNYNLQTNFVKKYRFP